MFAPNQFVKVWVDGGLLMQSRNSRKTRGVYWSIRCEDSVSPPSIIRRQDLRYRTNNDAEWLAMIEGLCFVVGQYKDRAVVIYSDSMMVVKQFNGEYRAKIERHHRWRTEARELAAQCKFVSVQWVSRKVNVEKLGH